MLSYCLVELWSDVTHRKGEENKAFNAVQLHSNAGSCEFKGGKKMKVSGTQEIYASYNREEPLREKDFNRLRGRKDFTVIRKGKQTTFT